MTNEEILQAWSDWYDKQGDELLELCKSDISQMAFYAGVKAAQQQRAVDLPTYIHADACPTCGGCEWTCAECLASANH